MDLSTIKQIVIPEGIVKKIEDGDGNVLWQKAQDTIQISYSLTADVSHTPETKTVQLSGGSYTLTSADLPTVTISSTHVINNWTIDGTNAVTAGTVITANTVLKAIHKITVAKKYHHTKDGYVNLNSAGTATAKLTATLYHLNTGATGTYTTSYSHSFSKHSGYYGSVGLTNFNGQIITFQTIKGGKFKIKWNPAVRSVTYTVSSSSWTLDKNYANTYPMILVRDGNTTTTIFTNGNVPANYTSGVITSGANANGYITFQYGGWDAGGGGKTAWAGQYCQSYGGASVAYPKSNKSGTITDTIYIYTQ